MAQEEEIPQSIRELNEALKVLNSTVETASERQKKFADRVKKNDAALDQWAAGLRDAAKTAKAAAEAERQIAERKKAYENDAVRRAQSLAREQIEAERETRTFASRLARAAGTTVEGQKALLVWTDRVKSAGQVVGNLGGTALGFAKGLAEGATKFTNLNPLIDGVVGSLGEMAKAIPFAGEAISGAMKLAAEGAKFMLGQLQSATEAFQEVSRAGAAGADGITGLMRQFQASGMTLEGYKKTITSNSQAMAMLGGTVAKGAEDFSKMSKSIVDSEAGDYLRRLGFTADEIGSTLADMLIIQQRSGAAQGRTQQQLAKASADLAVEFDAIAKLTGQSREESKKQLDAQMREARYLSTLRRLESEGRPEAAKEMKLLTTATAGVNNELSQAIRDASSGIVDSDVVKKFILAGVDVQGAVDRIKYGGESAEVVFRDLARQTKEALPLIEANAQIMRPENSPYPELYKAVDLTNIAFDKARAQGEQREAQDDQLTKSAASAQKSLEQMSRQMSALATSILPNFASVVAKITDVMNQGLQKMGVPGVVGGAAGTVRGGAAGAAAGAPAGLGTIAEKIIKAEGGGVTARNPYSSASGLGQITKGRYEDLVKQAPMGSRLKGTTFQQYQQDEGLQREALNAQIENLRGYLGSRKLPTTDAAVYLAHVFGPAGARQVLTHSDSTAVNKLFDQGIIDKNPAIFRGVTTVGDLKRVISDKMGGTGYATMAKGGITQGISIAGEAGPEAVIPLPDGRSVPVKFTAPSAEQLKKTYGNLSGVIPGMGVYEGAAGGWSIEGGSVAEQLQMALQEMIATNQALGAEMAQRRETGKMMTPGEWMSLMLSTPEGKVFAAQNMIGVQGINQDQSAESLLLRQQYGQIEGQIRQQNFAAIKAGRFVGGSIEDPLSRMEVLAEDYQARQSKRYERGIGDWQAGLAGDERMVEVNREVLSALQELVNLQRSNNSTQDRILQVSQN